MGLPAEHSGAAEGGGGGGGRKWLGRAGAWRKNHRRDAEGAEAGRTERVRPVSVSGRGAETPPRSEPRPPSGEIRVGQGACSRLDFRLTWPGSLGPPRSRGASALRRRAVIHYDMADTVPGNPPGDRGIFRGPEGPRYEKRGHPRRFPTSSRHALTRSRQATFLWLRRAKGASPCAADRGWGV
jgi:hypothetical protein